jgi:hypothetical protein
VDQAEVFLSHGLESERVFDEDFAFKDGVDLEVIDLD